MATTLNCFNTVIEQGKVTKLRTDLQGRPTVMFYLKNQDISLSVVLKDSLALHSTIEDGESVTVIGKLRYSTKGKTYKLMASKVISHGVVEIKNAVNWMLLEGYALSFLEGENGSYDVNFESLNLSKPDDNGDAEGFHLPVLIKFTSGKADYAKAALNIKEPFMIEGSLASSGAGVYVYGQHIMSAVKIPR